MKGFLRFHSDWQYVKNKIIEIQADSAYLEIPPKFVEFLIAAEDHRYGYHIGVDPMALCRAIWRSIFCGRKEGGSTIAMQLVRVITGRYERTAARKIIEMYLAMRLTRLVPMSELPALYLLVAYYGWGMNGLRQALHRLNLNPSNVSQMDAAKLIARLKYPEPQHFNAKRFKQIEARAKHIQIRSTNLVAKPYNRLFRVIKNNGSV